MTSDDLLLHIPPMVSAASIAFTTEGSSFAPVITVTGNPSIRWVWADGTTSNSPTPNKDYGSPGRRLNRLYVTPWSAVQRINIGYDAGDGGSYDIEYVPDQQVSAVRGLHHVAPYLAQWCSSYNQITSLDFSNFTNLDTIECFLSYSLRTVNLTNTPKLRRACFEDCNLESLDLSGSPNLEDLRGAVNDFSTINFGNIGAHVWHICMPVNPQLTNRTIFADMTLFPNIAELFIWNDNQTGSLRIPATHPTLGVSNTRGWQPVHLPGSVRGARQRHCNRRGQPSEQQSCRGQHHRVQPDHRTLPGKQPFRLRRPRYRARDPRRPRQK